MTKGPIVYIRFYGKDFAGKYFNVLLVNPKRGVKALGGTFVMGRQVDTSGDDIKPDVVTHRMIDETCITSEKEFSMSFKYGWVEPVGKAKKFESNVILGVYPPVKCSVKTLDKHPVL